MPILALSPDELLTTTFSFRRPLDLVRPLDPEELSECVEIALSAAHVGSLERGRDHPPPVASGRPSRAHFVVVTDRDQRQALAELYRKAMRQSADSTRRFVAVHTAEGRSSAAAAATGMADSDYLTEHLHELPALVVPCIAWRADDLPAASQAALWGSIFPAVWSLLLAARSRGINGIITTAHLQYEREAAEVLGLPFEEVMQAALIPLSRMLDGPLPIRPRPPIDAALHWDRW